MALIGSCKPAIGLPALGLSRVALHRHLRKHLHKRSSFRGSSAPRQQAADELRPVTDCIILFKVRQGVGPEDSEVMLDNMWSMQYRVPGPLCAFAGAIVADKVSDIQAGNGGYTHGLHIRFSSVEAARNFLTHPAYIKAHDSNVTLRCERETILVIESGVTPELESIFRRGPDWELGLEHITLLQAQGDFDEEEVNLFLGQLSVLAGSSLAGALQTTFGRLASNFTRSIEYSDEGKVVDDQAAVEGTHMIISRFERLQQLRAFLELPPCEALITDDGGTVPVKANQSFQMKIAPAESTNKSQPLSHRLPMT